MIAVGDNSETELLLLQPGLRTAPEVIMDTSASSATSSNNPCLCFDQQPEQTHNSRKKIEPERVSGHKKIKHTGPSVSAKSPVVADRRDKRLSDRLLEKTANTAPLKSGSMDLRLEAGDISIDDFKFRRSSMSVFKQLCTSISTAKELNNPVNDRSEFVERVRTEAFKLFRYTGFVLVATLFFMAIYTIINRLETINRSLELQGFKEFELPKRDQAPLLILALIYGSAVILTLFCATCPIVNKLSFELSSCVTGIIDTYEKKAASVGENNAEEQFLKKFNRMESLYHRLQNFRLSRFVASPPKCSVCQSQISIISVRSDRVGGKPKENVNPEDKSKVPWVDRDDISFYFTHDDINWKNLDKAIAETEEWLDSAEKQMQLLRNHSSDTLLLIDNEKLKLTPV